MPDIFSTIPSPLVTVIGEALIDLIPNGAHHEYRALPGGSPCAGYLVYPFSETDKFFGRMYQVASTMILPIVLAKLAGP